jgi:hypothetical protein
VTAPLVVAIDTGDSDTGDSDAGTGTTDIPTIDDSGKQGKPLGKIGALAKGYQPSCPSTSVEGCTELALDKKTSTIHLSSEVDVGEGGPGERITGLDLKTGKKLYLGDSEASRPTSDREPSARRRLRLFGAP